MKHVRKKFESGVVARIPRLNNFYLSDESILSFRSIFPYLFLFFVWFLVPKFFPPWPPPLLLRRELIEKIEKRRCDKIFVIEINFGYIEVKTNKMFGLEDVRRKSILH